MKSRTDLTVFELYALERAARLARSREVARLIRAGANALVRGAGALIRLAGRAVAVTVPEHNKEIRHA